MEKKPNTGVEQRGARKTLEIIEENTMKFNLPQKFLNKVKSFSSQKTPFTDAQCSMIDGLYEKYMGYGGFPTVKVKHDFNRKFK